jgi:hypothetical protein
MKNKFYWVYLVQYNKSSHHCCHIILTAIASSHRCSCGRRVTSLRLRVVTSSPLSRSSRRCSHGHCIITVAVAVIVLRFLFFFSIYTMPSSGIELCYHSREGLGSFHTVRKPLRDFPLSSIFIAWEHHFLISHTSSSFPHFATFRSVSLV